MESSAIAVSVLVPSAATQNGVLTAETPVVQGSDGAPSLFSRMLSGTTGTSQQLTVTATAGTALQIMNPVPMQLSADDGGQQAVPAAAANDPRPLLADGGVLSTLLAFQAAPSPKPESGEVPQLPVETVEKGVMPIVVTPVQNDTEETAEVRETLEKASVDVRKAADTSTDTTVLLLASAMQVLTSPSVLPQSQPSPQGLQRSDAADTKVQAVPEKVSFDGTPAVARAQVQTDTLPKAGTSVPTPVDNKVAPAPQVPAASPAGVAKSIDRDAPAVKSVATGRETPVATGTPVAIDRETPVEGEERSAQVVPIAGRSLKSAQRGGHEPVIQKGEAPAAVNSGPVMERPLLEVVVEEAVTDQSSELAAKPVKGETFVDAGVAAKSTHTLIGGAVVTKAEPPPAATVGETVRPSSHEQIMAQVKEQIGKAEFRADDGRVVLRLHPEELGSLRIDVKMDDQKLRLHIVAENPTVREALVANMDTLRESLSKQQIVMERFDVATGQGQDQQQLYREHRQQVQDGLVHRTNRLVSEYAEDGEVVNKQAMNAYWAPQDSSLLNVRF